jgi:hypothetical protein
VGDIHQHPQRVHAAYDVAAERRQPSGPPRIHRRAGPVVAVVPGQRQVASAARVQRVELVERILDGVAALDAHQRRDVSAGGRAAHIGRAGRELHLGRGVGEGPHRAHQRQRPGEGGPGAIGVVDPDREKGGGQPPVLHPRDVHVAVRQPHRHVGFAVEHALRGVDMAVDDDHRLLEHEEES